MFDVVCVTLLVTLQLHFTEGGGSTGVNPVTVTVNGYISIGSTLKIICNYPNVLPKSLVWYKDNDLIYVNDKATWKSSKYTVSPAADLAKREEHWLKIAEVHFRDAGTYKCIVKTNGGQQFTAVFKLQILPNKLVVNEYTRVVLHCHLPGSTPNVIAWKRNTELLSLAGIVVAEKNNTYQVAQLHMNGTDLVIVNVSAVTSGKYTCFNDGIISHEYNVLLYTPPESKHDSVLYGSKGIAFGAALGGVVVVIIAMTCYFQNKQPSNSKLYPKRVK